MNPHKTKKTILSLSVLIIYILTAGCVEHNEKPEDNNPADAEYNRFIGHWKGTQTHMGYQGNISLTCLSDGTFSSGNIMITSGWWDLQDNRFTMTSTEGLLTTYTYQFSENDTMLTLLCDTIDVQLHLTKQK